MRSLRRSLLAEAVFTAAFGLTSFVGVSSAHAQQCTPDGGISGSGDIIATFPGSRATNVPIDGFIRIRYQDRAPLRPFVIVQNTTALTPVTGTVSVVGNEVIWQSNEDLAPMSNFNVQVSDVASGAGENSFRFTTGTVHSGNNPPTFAGVQAAEAHAAGAADPCGQPDAREVTLSWNPATATGWADSDIEYVIYQTRGPNIAGPVERARERISSVTGMSCPGQSSACTAVRLTPENSAAPVCFNIQAVDPYGRQDGNTREVCTDPSRGNFFNGCSVSPTPSRPSLAVPATVATLASLATAIAVVRRRRRRARA